jgi:hypothetical protein
MSARGGEGHRHSIPSGHKIHRSAVSADSTMSIGSKEWPREPRGLLCGAQPCPFDALTLQPIWTSKYKNFHAAFVYFCISTVRASRSPVRGALTRIVPGEQGFDAQPLSADCTMNLA